MSSIWDRPEPGTRKPRHTREQIAAAALAIADREGFDAVSMRRVAQEIGAGTMTLYHYVRTKADLVDLMDDAIMGEVLIPDGELPEAWRAAVRMIACSSHAAFLRHPWALRATNDSSGGPNGMRHFDQSLAAVASLAIDVRAKLEVIGIVDDYVFGYVFRTAEVAAALSATTTEERIEELLPHFETQIRSGDYPHIQALFGDTDTRQTWELVVEVMTAESRFEHGLDLLLDGIEAKLATGAWDASGG
jgi:AcrR family transcriptional regulator